VAHEVVKLVFRISALVVCFASSVLILEVLGEPPWLSNEPSFKTGMGDISWFTLLYWACETLTTVGYGDFAPKTFPSRLVTTSFLIAGVAIFTYELNRILDMMAQTRKGGGSFTASHKRDHVVLVGGCVRYADRSALNPFLMELYQTSSRNDWPNLVLMTSLADSADKLRGLLQSLLPWHAQQYTTVLVGSPFLKSDLKRCGCDSASLVFFASDSTGTLPPMEEDKENILRALSLKTAFPSTPLRLMLLKAESKATAVSLGIRAERCFAMSEVCGGMMWMSCHVIGWATLFSNLVIASKPRKKLTKVEETQHPWMRHYMHGMRQSLCGFVPSSAFHGLTIREAVAQLYQKHSVIVIAVQINGSILLTPLRNTTAQISDRTVCFGIVEEEETLLPVSLHNRDWRDVFVRERWDKFLQDDRRNSQNGIKIGRINTGGFLPISSVVDSRQTDQRPNYFRRQSVASLEAQHAAATVAAVRASRRLRRSTMPSAQITLSNGGSGNAGRGSPMAARQQGLSEPLLAATRGAGPEPEGRAGLAARKADFAASPVTPTSAGNSPALGAHEPSGDVASISSPMRLPRRQPSTISPAASRRAAARGLDEGDLETLEERVQRFRLAATERPFILLLSLATSPDAWDDIADFVRLESRNFLPFRMPIVILCPVEPTKRIVEALRFMEDDDIGFCLGSPNWAQDLKRSGVVESSVIVFLGQPVEQVRGEGGSIAEMLDADVLMVQRMLYRLGQAHKHTVLQFNEIDNMRLMHTEQVCDRVGEHSWEEDNNFWVDPNFASGQVFFPRVLSSFLAAAYRKTGIIEMMTLFWGPRDCHDPDAPDTEMVWQIKPRAQHIGMRCGDVAEMLILDVRDPALFIGLLRRFDQSGGEETASSEDLFEGDDDASQHVAKGYVYTNPKRTEKVRASDLLFVLGDAAFGRRVLAEGLVPMAAPQDLRLAACSSESEDSDKNDGSGSGSGELQ